MYQPTVLMDDGSDASGTQTVTGLRRYGKTINKGYIRIAGILDGNQKVTLPHGKRNGDNFFFRMIQKGGGADGIFQAVGQQTAKFGVFKG